MQPVAHAQCMRIIIIGVRTYVRVRVEINFRYFICRSEVGI